MKVSLVAAVARNGVIGNGNRMPWHIPGEMAVFRRLTVGKVLILGRKTHNAIGKVLPDRITLVLTSDATFHHSGVNTIHSLEEGLEIAKSLDRDVVIGGGAEVYRLGMPYCDRMYLTHIHRDYAGDTFFPQWSRDDWEEVIRTEIDASPCYHVSEYARRR